jgi:hypothetical protein
VREFPQYPLLGGGQEMEGEPGTCFSRWRDLHVVQELGSHKETELRREANQRNRSEIYGVLFLALACSSVIKIEIVTADKSTRVWQVSVIV